MPVAVVTDSTASLPAAVVAERGIRVVPLQVVIGAQVYDEVLVAGAQGGSSPGSSLGATPAMVAEALREFRPVSTSRPTPSALLEVYERAASEGATEIVSIHLSGEMSGTYESAQLAARDASVPVHAVDSRQVGVATGYAALTAADVVAAGGSALEAVEAAHARADSATSLFYVDTLEYLRRGGRIGAAAALFGGALSVKPLLKIEDGRVANLEKVRTAGKALNRLEALVLEAAGDAQVDVCVAHLASPDRAGQLAERLGEELAENLCGRDVWCTEVGAVLGAHVGPGMVAVCVAPLLGQPEQGDQR
jgi:DegV family protein with EDD domain